MSDNSATIERFRKMANDDPSNVMAHFSLGRELLTAGAYADAVHSFERVIALDPNISRAYQFMADALLKQDQRDRAVEQLTAGLKVADARGDMLPKNEMIRRLQELGAPLPELRQAPAAAEPPVGEGQVNCRRCNRVAPKLPKPPMRGALGQEIYEKVCADCWRQWIPQGTKVINELRLTIGNPQHDKAYDQHMIEFLNLR